MSPNLEIVAVRSESVDDAAQHAVKECPFGDCRHLHVVETVATRGDVSDGYWLPRYRERLAPRRNRSQQRTLAMIAFRQPSRFRC